MDETDNSNLSLSTNVRSENDSSCVISEVLNSKVEDEDDDDIGEYYFESDHLALRNNNDYKKLLKAVVVLQAQRSKALQDVDILLEAKEAALADPIAFVEKLQKGENLNLPKPQKIYTLPVIDWSKYAINGNTPSFTHKHMTRHKKPSAIVTSPSPPPQANDSNSGSSSNEFRVESDESTPALVRGRISNMPKSQTFNQLWSVEEQKRLEDLLIKYPVEEVEARRWEKIAKALGNRTPQQVASRVQKYFIKLWKLGLPVPGRIPHIASYGRRPGIHRHQRHNKFLFQSSTFLASCKPPVFMSDYDDDNSGYTAATLMDNDQYRIMDEEKDDELIPPHLRNTAEYQELMYLKRLKKAKVQNKWQNAAQQQGYECANCSCEPTLGRCWQCIDCPPHSAFYLCDDCSDCNMETLTHVSGHRLEPVGEMQNSFVDGDYTQFVPGDYNYLDPNYMPAT